MLFLDNAPVRFSSVNYVAISAVDAVEYFHHCCVVSTLR